MAQVPGFLGDVRKGDKVQFAVDTYDASWIPAYYDVLDNETKAVLTDLSDQPVDVATDSPNATYWIDFAVLDGTEDFVEGRMYSIVVKSQTGTPQTGAGFLMTFRVVAAASTHSFLGVVEKGKNLHFLHREDLRAGMWYDVIDPEDGNAVFSNVAMTGPLAIPGDSKKYFSGEIESEGTDDLAVGRTYWVRVKGTPTEDASLDTMYSFTVLPRLEYSLLRLLSYAGENVVFDNFAYDQAGNILGMRVRSFENATDADNATLGTTDPEPGEMSSLVITQEHDTPRNVRTFHKSVLDFLSGNYPKEQ